MDIIEEKWNLMIQLSNLSWSNFIH